MNKKSNIDIDKMKLIKIIGRGMYGTVYLSKYKQKLFAYKIEHILEKDIHNKKSNIWKEINFSIKFANNYKDQFMTLYNYDILNNCDHKQDHIWDISFFNNKLQKEFTDLSNSNYCIRKIYSLVDNTLGEIINTLTKEQIYSFIIQFSYIIYLLETNNYIHGDIHQNNIGVIKTSKKYIKILNNKVPTFGYIYQLIDYGRVLHKKDIISKTDKQTYYNLYGNEVDFILTILLSNLPLTNYIKKNKIEANEMNVRKTFPNSNEDIILNTFCNNDDDKCRNYKFNLYKILYPESYQKELLGNKFKKVIEPILRIDLIDILYILKTNFDKHKIIDYFMLKL